MILVCVEAELNIKNAAEDDKKRPLDNQEVFRGLRFLADSNRRTRFCRPPPSHSAKEPFFISDCKCRKICNEFHKNKLKHFNASA